MGMLTALANPERFMRASAAALPIAAVIAALMLAVGLPWGFLYAPADFRQGFSARIMYVHVPAAWWALGIFTFMGVASFVGLVWRHPLADIAARAAAPIGAVYAGLCLVTGSFWGAPTWGTWWEWDVRLTSMLILFLTYVGYLALWAAIEDETRAARLAAILCLAGVINVPIVRFSVDWWQRSLHQTTSMFRADGPAMAPSQYVPLLWMAGAFFAAFVALLLAGMRTEVYRRRAMAAAMRRARDTA